MSDAASIAATGRVPARTLRRRWFFWPLIIAVAAVAVWQVTQQRTRQQSLAIQRHVESLCADVAAGRAVDAAAIPAREPFLRLAVLEALSKATASQSTAAPVVAVEVTPGDHPDFGDGSATHVAIIRIDGHERLGLRVVHLGGEQGFTIIGYWANHEDTKTRRGEIDDKMTGRPWSDR